MNNGTHQSCSGDRYGHGQPSWIEYRRQLGSLIAGKSGIDKITLFDAGKHTTRFAGEVKGFEPTNFINRKEARRMDRFAQFAVAASQEAVKQANLTIDDNNRNNIGVLIGSGAGG